MIYYTYKTRTANQLNRKLKFVLEIFNLYEEKDDLYWRIVFQYLTFTIIFIMIVLNVRGFLANLLFSLKNILKDHSIKLSYNAVVLIFSFVIVSLNLP